ncbi:hypothetical protein [Kordia sp.]|uniref:hypothetical protein n=1 Tax=Kordia sp. TaxID=1965332 RepID=UPI0025B8545A|nr:hypothetical protein [Kordia sp.]MCH2195205.1 hypothetical protein [Kordia sp.]
MRTNNLEGLQLGSDVFSTWQLIMIIIGVGCFCILLFISIVIYKYVHRFDLDDTLHR